MKFIKKLNKRLKKKVHKFKYLHFDKKYTVQKPYPSAFLNEVELNQPTNTKVNKNIFCCWTGNNEMSANRKRGIKSMHEKCGVEITLVSPKNINDYILKEFPLHPAYEYLSLVHRSDYLRCYLMHHHGGGYSDVKPHFNSWSKSFDLLNSDPTKIILGYHEISTNCATQLVDFGSINQSNLIKSIVI